MRSIAGGYSPRRPDGRSHALRKNSHADSDLAEIEAALMAIPNDANVNWGAWNPRREGTKVRRKTRCRKCGERCQRMKAKIARFDANQAPNISNITITNT
jgi:hypothetical protein